MKFSFGGEDKQRLEIDVLSYERPISSEYYDDNWLVVSVQASVGGFRGDIGATIQTGELVSFLEGLKELHSTLRGEAEFTTLEQQIHLKLICDSLGHIELSGELVDRAGTGNRLEFELKFDQTDLRRSVEELENVVQAFPVRK